MKEKLRPWFWEMPWQVESWLTSPTRLRMGLAERGLFFEMLAYQWKEGFVPDSPEAVAAYCGVTLAEVKRVWASVRAHFGVLKNGTLRNARMEKIRRVKIGTHVSRIESSRKAASVRWSKHKSNYAPAMRSDANREQRTITEKKEDSPPTPSHALPDYDPTDLVAWLVQEYPQHRQRGPWQYALADLIDQDHAANRPAGYSEALIRAGLPRFQRSQQWRDGKVENLERWLREKLFIHPPPEHEGEHSKPSPPPETVDEYMARKARERGQTT